jgi:molybdopterin converting factor small subunit
MPHEVWIPPVHRDLTHGVERVAVDGASVGAVIDSLDAQFPGLAARLSENGRLRPGIAVAVDGVIAARGWRHKLTGASEIHFVPAMAGG